jgi:two-component system LytT family response regulator
MRAVIVDDEPHVRENLRLRLDDVSDVEVVAECANGREAITAVRDDAPDLLFLDVQMPGLDGFDVLEELGADEMPFVVFVTAHDEYAVRAFEINAVDYLLKPIDEDRFDEALERARTQIGAPASGDTATALEERLQQLLDTLERTADSPADAARPDSPDADRAVPDRLIVKSRGRVQFVPVADVRYVESAGDYVELHTEGDTHLLRETMSHLADRLGREFQRIHRSTIVNLSYVAELRPTSHGEYAVLLDDDTRLKLSRTYRESFQDALGTSL